jgi:hypothetical protein
MLLQEFAKPPCFVACRHRRSSRWPEYRVALALSSQMCTDRVQVAYGWPSAFASRLQRYSRHGSPRWSDVSIIGGDDKASVDAIGERMREFISTTYPEVQPRPVAQLIEGTALFHGAQATPA